MDIKQALAGAYTHGLHSGSACIRQAAATRSQAGNSRQGQLICRQANGMQARQTRTWNGSSTDLISKAMQAGKLLAAAEHQPPVKRLWLDLAYNPMLDIYTKQKQATEAQLNRLCFGLYCFYPKPKTPHLYRKPAFEMLFRLCLQDAIFNARRDDHRMKTSSTFKAEQMGYGSGRQAYQKADYSRQWLPVEQSIKALLMELDQAALDGVMQYLENLNGSNEQNNTGQTANEIELHCNTYQRY